MINTFQLITIFGTGDAKSLSSGISEALMTTALGLVVAIPTLILHGALSRMAKRKLGLLNILHLILINNLEFISELIFRLMFRRSRRRGRKEERRVNRRHVKSKNRSVRFSAQERFVRFHHLGFLSAFCRHQRYVVVKRIIGIRHVHLKDKVVCI